MLERILRSVVFLVALPILGAAPEAPLNAAEFEALLDRLPSTASVLYVAAHPDDENTALLSYLVSERGFRTGYLSVTRGDGGQNLIGGEKGDYLGVIRTQELLAAREIDQAEQFFTRAVDFGYSKSAEETFRIWGKEAVLADVVYVVRKFRPDVIITRFPTTGEGGHGQHTASAILAVEAFTAAADPKRFPEQLNLVKPWQPKRIFWNVFRWNSNEPVADDLLKVDLGTYNEVLGRSYTEIAARSRSMHKSQGFGAAEQRGSLLNYFKQLGGDPASSDPFEGIDTGWQRFANGTEIARTIRGIRAKYDPRNPATVVPDLVALHKLIAPHAAEPIATVRTREVERLIRAAAGLWIEAIADRPSSTSADPVTVAATIVNRSNVPVILEAVGAGGTTKGWGAPKPLVPNEPLRQELVVSLLHLEPTQPYWLAQARSRGLHHVQYLNDLGKPANDPPVVMRFHTEIAGAEFTFHEPVVYRYTDRVRGEIYQPFVVVPRVTLGFDEPLLIFSEPTPRKVTVYATNQGSRPVKPMVTLNIEEGWAVTPDSIQAKLEQKGSRFAAEFMVTPPKNPSAGSLKAEASFGAEKYDRGIVTIDYEHIPKQTLFPAATVPAVRMNLERAGERIGYIMGAGDDVPDVLRQAGYKVTLVTDEMLTSRDLDQFDAIVVGVRAFNSREALKSFPQPLFEFAEKGGTVVVQYNTADKTLGENISPIPLKLSRDRVTVEEAPVVFVDPKHPLLNSPNKIGSDDFEGWVQERGLYFPNEWDSKFQPVLEMNDPGESPKKGSILYARHGKGVFIYTGLSFFRQLPAAVPGAVRLFSNLIANRSRN